MTRIRRRYLVLHGLRWLPSGLLIPVMVLLMLERGIGLSQIGLIFAIQGFVVLGLELPTGGLADALGRKPVLVAAAAFSLASLAMFAVAQTVWMFAVALLLQGIYRALESGPLDAWYVDAALAADPRADLEGGLSAAGVVTGVSIASGALLAGGLVALGPMGGVSALTVPVIVAVALSAVDLAALAWLLVEDRPGRGVRAVRESVRAVPGTIGSAVRLVRRSRIVLALICVEIFWGFGMVTFETLLPVRLSDVVGNPDTAAALLGPAGSAAWLASAGGAALAPVVARRIGVPLTAGLLRILQGATVVGDGSARRAGRRADRVPGLLRRPRRVQPAAHGAAAPAGGRPVPDDRRLAQLDDGSARGRGRRDRAHRAGRRDVRVDRDARRRGGAGPGRAALHPRPQDGDAGGRRRAGGAGPGHPGSGDLERGAGDRAGEPQPAVEAVGDPRAIARGNADRDQIHSGD